MGTPTIKSFKPLITEDDCSLTADYYLQVPYKSYLPTLEPNWSYHQIHRKQIIGTPTRKSCKPLIATSKSCKPLIAEDDCSLTADYYLQVPYMSYHWNQICLPSNTTETKNRYTN